MRKTTIVDDDGNEIPPPDQGSPVALVIYLLEYGRKRGFQIGPTLQIGDVIVQVKDLRAEEVRRRSHEPDVAPGSDMAKVLGLEE